MEGHVLVILAPNLKQPRALSCELLEPKPWINSAPCIHIAPGKKLHPSSPAPLQCLKSMTQILHLETT